MAIVSGFNYRRALGGLAMSPAELARARAHYEALYAEAMAVERARYAAMSEEERRQYDVETTSMFPRAPKGES